MSTATELLHYRHNPADRIFQMRKSKRQVYDEKKLDGVMEERRENQEVLQLIQQTFDIHKSKITKPIYIFDHIFDDPNRLRLPQRISHPSDVPGLRGRGVMIGEKAVREQFKLVKSKILPEDLLGIDD